VSDVSAFVGTIMGSKAAQAMNRRRMAILLATLVLLVLASPIAEMTSQARLVIVVATVAFLLACLQQVDAHPRLRVPSRLIVLLWLILNLPLPWSEGPLVTDLAAGLSPC
jgi:hypothetical protein